MKLTLFTEKLEALHALPPEERNRARALVEKLSETERGELFAKLTELNERLTHEGKDIEQALASAETIVTEMERGERALERKMTETKTRQSDVRAAEEKLSDQP